MRIIDRFVFPLAAIVVSLFAGTPTNGEDVQFGIRLDSGSSIQWRGRDLYCQNERRYVTRTRAGEIRDLWPGPRRGLFAIHTASGLGLLLGTDAQILATPDPPAAILRSSRPDVVWSGHVDRRESVIHEWWSSGHGRDILRVPGRLVDFDASADGWIAALVEPDGIFIRSDRGEMHTIPLPRMVSPPIRVFLETDHAHLALVSSGELCRTVIGAPTSWSREKFDPRTEAIIRHVWSGRVAIEDRFTEAVRN